MGEGTAEQAAVGGCPTTKKTARCTGDSSKNTDTVSVKVEDYDGTYDCLICGASVCDQPALHCSRCHVNPLHQACVATGLAARPQCQQTTVVPFTGAFSTPAKAHFVDFVARTDQTRDSPRSSSIAHMADVPVLDGRDVSPANLARIKSQYAAHGFVCVRLLSAAQCDELVREQWRRVILQQEWTDEYKIVVRDAGGRALDVNSPADHHAFVDAVVGPLTAATRKKFEAGWPLHRGFGACCDPAVFHLEGVWGIRQDPDLYRIASEICGEQHLWTTLDRSIQKLPGQGAY